MPEELGKVLNKGFGTWARNPAIAIPFFLNVTIGFFITMAAFVILTFLIVTPSISSVSDPSLLSSDEGVELIMSMFADNIFLVATYTIMTLIVVGLVQSYFTAGAIGMAKKASQKGHTTFSDMFSYGKKNMISLFLAKVMIFLISLAGIIFIVPGALTMGDIDTFISNPENAVLTSILLLFGILLWGLYAIFIGIALSPVEFCLVVDRMDAMEGITRGLHFFMENKIDVFLLFILMLGISVFSNIIGELLSTVEILGAIWGFMSLILSIFIIQPLVTVWWVRLYMTRTGQELYDLNELLDYPE